MNDLELLERGQNGDKEAFDAFFEANQGLVYSLLKRYQINPSEYEDLVQEANYGLFMAMKKYDFSYNVNFSTYAVPLILGEIRKHFRYGNAIKISRGLKDLSRKINEMIEGIEKEGLPYPSIEEIALSLNETKENVIEAMTLQSYVISGDNELSEDNDDTIISNYCNDTLSLSDLVSLKVGLESLDKKERLVLELRYFGGLSQLEISKRLNMSQVQVSRLESKILSKLKNIV